MQIRCSNCFHEYDEVYGLCPNCGYAEGEVSAEAYCLTPGTRITDRYIVGETLGVGGFGITYKAWDVQLNTVLAIKEYFPCGLVNRTIGDPTVFLVANKRADEFQYGKTRFLDEARNMAKFSSHHNIVNVFNYFEANNTVYIVMEYLDGLTLSQTLQARNGPLPVDRCVSIAIDICDALESIHKEEILHRDVSPDNIMLCRDGTVKLFDFGAARFSSDAAVDSKLTVIIKPGFAPPEQYDKFNQQDARTDLYALGATLYYAVTGMKPEESTNRKLEDNLRSPKELGLDIPAYFNNAIMRAMAIEPHYRFENIQEFRKVLQQKIEVGSVSQERKKRVRRRILGIGAALLVVAVAFLGFALGWVQKDVPAGSVEIWYMSSGDPEQDAAESAIWANVQEMFTQDYPEVELTITGIPEESYEQQLAQAEEDGEMPDIYESTNLPDKLLNDAQPLTSLISASGDLYLDGLGERTVQYPTGMIVPAIYTISVLDTDDFDEMVEICEENSAPLMVSPDAAEMYEELYDVDLSEYVSEDALNQFVNGKSLIYLGTSADLPEAQEITRNGYGMYNVLFPQTDESIYRYGSMWSCSKMDKDTTRIAHAVLSYLNVDRVQDYFNIRNFEQSGCIPVSKSAIEKYITEGFSVMEDVTEFLELPYAR